MINRKRHKNKVNNSVTNIERDYTSTDDLHYFIEKIRNKGKSLTTALYSQSQEPEYITHYTDFMQQYIGFMLTNISGIYKDLADWIKNNPTIRDKIQIIDSNDISPEVFSYVITYLDKKLTPSVNSIVLSLLGISPKEVKINLETHNIPALAFLSPPGTSKTYSIVAALKELSEGQGNSIIAGWLHYDITKHEATTSPLVLPTANQDVKDEPLPGLSLLRASGNLELDKALQENIYAKTVNKIISTFGYILVAGKEKGVVSLSNEVENTLKQGINLNSTELSMWKLAVIDKPDEKTISTLIDNFRNVIPGFARVTNVLQENKLYINNDADALINAINYGDFESSDPEKDVQDFCEIALILHKLITFSLVPIIAVKFRNFIRAKKLDENANANADLLDGIMYIYNKIHNHYLHRIISTVFLIKALLKTDGQYTELFKNMIKDLKVGLDELLNNYYESYKPTHNSETTTTYLDLEEKVNLKTEQTKVFNFYNKIYMFLINAQPKEKDEYVLLDERFMNTVLNKLVLDKNNTTISFGSEEAMQTENRQYRSTKARQYSDVEYPEGESDYFSDNKLSFADHIRLISDTINDFYEVRKFYSNATQSDLSNQESKTTLERLKGEFGERFLNLRNAREDDIPDILNVVFTVIDHFKKELTETDYKYQKRIHKKEENLEVLSDYKEALVDLFTKSLNVIVYSPRYGHLINNSKLGTKDIDIFSLVGDYILSGLGITESLQTKGVSYSFPPAVQVFLLRAKQAYYKYLRQLRAMIEANMKRMDATDSINKATASLRPPLYVLFIDEMMTQLTPENFLFWLNIWNGLISPANPTVDTYPPNLCFVLAGNMPWSTFILAQALAQSSFELDYKTFKKAFEDANVNNIISVDTINALGSRISLRIVTYDYTYLFRTDESAVRNRTGLFIRALTKGLLNRKDLIHFPSTAQNLLGGFYDYYKIIVSPRLKGLSSVRLSTVQKMKLHAYIASLTAASDNIPFNLSDIKPNSIIKSLIEKNYNQVVSQDEMDEVISKATILNYLFNSETFGKTIYEYMFGTYFNKNPKEADYFNRLINVAISPIVLHLSFLHSYLTWNNMMRRFSKDLLDKAEKNKDKQKILDAITKLMKATKDASKLLNTKMTKAESIESTMGKRTEIRDRLDSDVFSVNRDDFMEYLKSQSDPRFCDPEVGSVISLLSLVFYHYIRYMKEFNENISKTIVNFCEKLETLIEQEGKNIAPKAKYDQDFSTLKNKIYSYFIDSDQDIDSREDLLIEASGYAYDLSGAVRINLLSFDPNKKQFEFTWGKNKYSGTYPNDADNSITVTLIPKKGGSNAEKGLNQNDIKAIKALVAYTIYTHSLVSQKDKNEKLSFSQNLMRNILVSNKMHAPLVGHLALGFFRKTDENQLFLIQALRETDRWFTSVTGSIVRYITIMVILRHIFTYRYIDNMPDMIKGFMDEVKKSNAFSKSVENKLISILDEFAELLFEARQAVFTPLANRGKQGQSDRYYVFNYQHYEIGGSTTHEGYHTKPDNQVNFGPLSFVFEQLKDLNIVQYDNSNNNSENSEEEIIRVISERFVQYLKGETQKSTTSFFPIHLISHIETKTEDEKTKHYAKVTLEFEDISSLIYQNKNIRHITMPLLKPLSQGQFIDLRHKNFYHLKSTRESEAYSISGLITVLNGKLKSIQELEEKFNSVDVLIQQNTQLQEGAKDPNNDNFILLLHNFQSLTDNYQNLELNVNDSIFEDLKKVETRYPSVKKYLNLWLKERNDIILFFKNLLEAVAKNNLDNLSKTVASVLEHLDNYIVDVAKRLINKVTDKDIRKMLEQISDISEMDKLIESIIKGIMNSEDLKNYIEGSTTNYLNIRKDETTWEECIKYQITLLKPLIKYSLAIILSNMVLVEYDKDNAAQGINKEEFYNKLKEAIKHSYNKTVKSYDVAELDYLSMIVTYIFFDMNQNADSLNKITLSDFLITFRKEDLQEGSEEPGKGPTTNYQLVRPFFTHYDKETKEIEKQEQNNSKTIKKREVFAQYVYIEDNGKPILYCDIHHMPIRGIQEIDGTVKEMPSKITIYSSDAFKSDQHGYTYTQLTFIRNMVIPRYEFAESALVNLLLIAGIQEIQKYLSSRGKTMSGLVNKRFAPFAITNLYRYYYEEIKDNNKSPYELINKVIQNNNSSGEHKHLHPLLASILLSFNSDNKHVKMILENDYGLKTIETYSRRDDFINALRLRFYSLEDIGNIKSIEYDMYSIYEPGVSIK